MQIKKFISFFILCGIFLNFDVQAIMPNIHSSGMTIDPVFSYSQIYNSNIYLEPKSQAKHDWISSISAGLNASLPLVPERGKDIVLEAKYLADVLAYWRHTNRTRTDQNFAGLFNTKFLHYFNLNINQRFKRTADPANSELTQLWRRYRNTTTVSLTSFLKQISLTFNFSFVRDAFDGRPNISKDDLIYTGGIFWQMFPKTYSFLEYDFGKIYYDNNTTNSNSFEHQARVGATGELWPKAVDLVKMGYRYVDYYEKSKKDFSGLTFYGDIKYDLAERTRIRLLFQRTTEESTYDLNSYFISNYVNLRFSHDLTERWNGILDGYYRFNNYSMYTTQQNETARRKDNFWGGKVGASYIIREWVTSSLFYDISYRRSNFSEFNYLQQRGFGTIAFVF